MRVLAKLPQRYWLERFRPLGGLSSDRLEVWLQVVAHRVGEGIEPLLLDHPLQAGVAGIVQGVEQHPLVPLQRAAWEES